MKTPFKPADAARHALRPLLAAGTQLPTTVSLSAGGSANLQNWIQGVHFDPTFLTPFELGRKVLRLSLFQFQCLGALPAAAQVSLGVNASTSEPFLRELLRGMAAVAAPQKIALSFGNSTHAPQAFLISVLTTGTKPKAFPSARPGDRLVVTGTVGTAAAGLAALKRFGWPAIQDYARVTQAHLRPEPPLEFLTLARQKAWFHSPVPLVDGVASDAHHLGETNRVGLRLLEENLPVEEETLQVARYLSTSARQWLLQGAEDQGLLFTVAENAWPQAQALARKTRTELTEIGGCVAVKEGMRVVTVEGKETPLLKRSWNPLLRARTAR
ncbi:hypothetical protein K2X33_06430 [bacterium]|nr:hypothetical protein [bacterium]